jgi:hypothetical protein
MQANLLEVSHQLPNEILRHPLLPHRIPEQKQRRVRLAMDILRLKDAVRLFRKLPDPMR